jgi:hypothetical protein
VTAVGATLTALNDVRAQMAGTSLDVVPIPLALTALLPPRTLLAMLIKLTTQLTLPLLQIVPGHIANRTAILVATLQTSR